MAISWACYWIVLEFSENLDYYDSKKNIKFGYFLKKIKLY